MNDNKEFVTINIFKNRDSMEKNSPIYSRILSISLPLTISGFFQVILMSSNSILITNRLMTSGYSSIESMEIFGRIMGMTMPLITLPFIVTYISLNQSNT